MPEKSKPVRVLHVLQRMEAGGTQAFLMNLYRNIDREKVQFDFLVEYSERQFYDDEIESLGGRIYRATLREDLNLPKFIRYLRMFFKEHGEYDIVHCHAYTVGYFVLRAAERAGVIVRIAHSHSNNMSGATVPLKIAMRSLFPMHATDLMACSYDAGSFLFGSRRFTVVKNAIDVDKFQFNPEIRKEVRTELGLDNSFVVGNVGRLHHQKNQSFLLDVFRAICLLRDDVQLLMVGSGPLKGELVEKAERIGVLDRLTLLENRSDMERLYQAMDVFVLSSLYEGLGIVAIEAQSSGLPTICSDGVSEDANISSLFRRVPPGASASSWAQIILSAAGHRDSRGGLQGAREHEFDVAQSSRELEQWYWEKARHAI